MARKKDILTKIRILITQKFESPEEAFRFFDKNGDLRLKKSELKQLVKNAEVSGFLSGIVAGKMINGLDQNGDDQLNWKEFRGSVKKLIKNV